MKKLKILKIMNDWATSPEREKLNSFGGCGYYRTVKIAEQLSPEYEVTVWNREWKDKATQFGNNMELLIAHIFTNYDIVWLHYTDNPITFAWLRTGADKYKKKLIMDLDDNFLEVDKKNPALKKQNRGKLDTSNKVAMLGTILSFCDAITVSTLPLKKRLEKHLEDVHNMIKPIYVIPNANDLDDWQHEKAEEKGIVIGYCGGLSHRDDLDLVLPAIRTVMETYPHIGFQLMGQMDLTEAKKVFGKWPQSIRERIILSNATKTQPEYPLHLSLQPWSIGICPLISSPFNECKSSIKWLEYSMYKIPTIASTVYPYNKDVLGRDTIVDGETGLLANDNEWVEKLSLLIENEELRKTLGENAYKHVKNKWQYKDLKQHILSVVEEF